MFYPQEFCPNCQELRDMEVSLSLHSESVIEIEGAAMQINYRCIMCHTLVYQTPLSEEPQEEVVWPTALNA